MKTAIATLKDILALKCLDCCGGDWDAVLNCTSTDCPLLTTRPTGRRDKLKAKFWSETKGHLKILPVLRKREVSDEQRAAAAERLAKFRETKA